MVTKTNAVVGGFPVGGNNGDIIVRDNAAVGGYKWVPDPGAPTKIQIANTALEVVDSLVAVDFPWSTSGQKAFKGKLANVDFLKVAARSSSADPTLYPGAEGDILVRFSTGTTAKVHVQADTVGGRNIKEDGSKLDNIQAGANKNPTAITAQEVSEAATITFARTFTPKNIVEIANSLNIGNFSQVTAEEKNTADTTVELRSFSPADVYDIFNKFNKGEPNPTVVNLSEIANSGAYDGIRSYTPNRVRLTVLNLIVKKESPEFNLPEGYSTQEWDHQMGAYPDSLSIRLICQVADKGFVVGDVVHIEYNVYDYLTIVSRSVNKILIRKSTYEPRLVRLDKSEGMNISAASWRFQIIGTWIFKD